MGVLDGRTILITGASSGLGAHWTRLAVGAGARVVAAARRRDRLDALAAELGDRVHAVAMDVADPASVAAGFAAGAEAFGPIDGVVANAGIAIDQSVLEITPEALAATMTTNVAGVLWTAQEGARRMLAEGTAAREAGRIVLVSSILAGAMVSPGVGAYSASKAAVLQFGRVMAREWARRGISVNIVCPGYVGTEMTDAWFSTEPGKRHIASWSRRRLMAAGDLDGVMTFLLSDNARATTGSVFTVDDGQSL